MNYKSDLFVQYVHVHLKVNDKLLKMLRMDEAINEDKYPDWSQSPYTIKNGSV